jgi:hypothetical protein
MNAKVAIVPRSLPRRAAGDNRLLRAAIDWSDDQG